MTVVKKKKYGKRKVISLSVSASEDRKIRAAAKRSKVGVSTWIRGTLKMCGGIS